MTATKPRRAAPPPTARPKMEDVTVASPTVPGAVERVQKIMDPLSTMFKRKQISERAYLAGDHYRLSYERLHGASGGAMDFERARGGGLPGSPPAPAYLIASEVVSQVRRCLYPQDFAIVYRICVLGMTLREAGENLLRTSPSRQQEEDCGRRLREGLGQMADWWFPERHGTGSRMRSHVEERATSTDASLVPKRGGVVHATRDRVFRS